MNKFEVNAAIEDLIESDVVPNIEAARVVIEFGDKLELSSGVKISIDIEKNSKRNKKIIGSTPEHGNVSIDNVDGEGKKKKTIKKGYNNVRRVGHYRLWKDEQGEILINRTSSLFL
jgi:hypothetical protein